MKLCQWTNELTSEDCRSGLKKLGLDLAWDDYSKRNTFQLVETGRINCEYYPQAIITTRCDAETETVRSFTFPANDPTNVHVAGVAATSFRLFWQDNATNEKRYEIWIKRGNGSFRLAKTVRANGTAALIKYQSQGGSALKPNTEYTVKVRAINRAGVPSGFSREVSLKTLAQADRLPLNKTLMTNQFAFGS
jgi:hypothetical protein